MKKLAFIKRSNGKHWVGDGFPVKSIFSYSDIAEEMSPFLLLDYAGPADFPPTTRKLGVGQHPHRGFETVTINVKVAQATHETPFSPRGRRAGGEAGNSGSMLPARRTIPACKPECALQVRGGNGHDFHDRGISTVMTVRLAVGNGGWLAATSGMIGVSKP
jgi:hypothetical protein